MLPVVAGADATRRQILLYSLLLVPVGCTPWLLGYAGLVYGAVALVCGALMLAFAWRVWRDRTGPQRRRPRRGSCSPFRSSISSSCSPCSLIEPAGVGLG